MDNYLHIRDWVDDLPKVGRISFSLEDAKMQFPDMSDDAMRSALRRLSEARKVHSVWRGFYVLVLPEYGRDGTIPPVEYINQLMSYIGTDYYVALLSAASYQGASHQAPQVFQVVTGKQLRSKTISGSRLEFFYKKNMPRDCIDQKIVKSGYINVSAPALTAIDLVSYISRSGGISHVATVLSELAESIDFSILSAGLLRNESCATVQRLGYLLESVLGEGELAESLYDKSVEAGLEFSRADLAKKQDGKTPSYDNKWKIVINYDVEVDE
ncbi:MAG: type IV toxin-antitoxin system AbiEi family antitoxin [Coriobacteriia bacterium]|nr:type IV toxin-antitoxin system AbiEi family antitoxin [Coriobacteriia bacterium]